MSPLRVSWLSAFWRPKTWRKWMWVDYLVRKIGLIRKIDSWLKDITYITYIVVHWVCNHIWEAYWLTGENVISNVPLNGFRKSIKLSNHTLLLYNYFPFEDKAVGVNKSEFLPETSSFKWMKHDYIQCYEFWKNHIIHLVNNSFLWPSWQIHMWRSNCYRMASV